MKADGSNMFKNADGSAKSSGPGDSEMTGLPIASMGSAVGMGVGSLVNKGNSYTDLVNTQGATHSSQLGFGTGAQSTQFAQGEAKVDAKHQAAGDAMMSAAGAAAMIPGIGWIAGGVLGLAGGLTKAGVFKSQKKAEARANEDKDKLNKQYSQMRGDESTAASQDALRTSANEMAMGGYADNDYLNLFGKENDFGYGGNPNNGYPTDDSTVAKPGGYRGVPSYSDNNNGPMVQDVDSKTIYKVNGGGTHEQDPNGGTTISVDPDGTPNKAEEGEMVVELPSGQFVFSNRF